jgi:hypothetical protein
MRRRAQPEEQMRILAVIAVLCVALSLAVQPALAAGGHGQRSGGHGQRSSATSRARQSDWANVGRFYSSRPDSLYRSDYLSSPWRGSYRHHAYSHSSPGLNLNYSNGHFSGSLNFGRYHRTYCSPRYSSPYYYGSPRVSYYVGGRPVYVYGDSATYLDLPVRTYPDEVYPYSSDDYSGPVDVPVTTYNDNRVTNNYYGTGGQVVLPQDEQMVAPAPAPAKQQSAAASDPRPFGQRFLDKVRLDTRDGAYQFSIRNGALYAGHDSAKAVRLADNVDTEFGAFAAWLPGDGACVFYRQGDGIFAAYPAKDGWAHNPLPYLVRFGPDTSIGLVNGLPWAVFNTTDGQRYVVQFGGHQWNEVGSAKPKPARTKGKQ